jgi:hypothetical protein
MKEKVAPVTTLQVCLLFLTYSYYKIISCALLYFVDVKKCLILFVDVSLDPSETLHEIRRNVASTNEGKYYINIFNGSLFNLYTDDILQ